MVATRNDCFKELKGVIDPTVDGFDCPAGHSHSSEFVAIHCAELLLGLVKKFRHKGPHSKFFTHLRGVPEATILNKAGSFLDIFSKRSAAYYEFHDVGVIVSTIFIKQTDGIKKLA